MAVEYKGGCCQVCGYNRCAEALEFHHLDPSRKDFGISHKGYARSWKRVKNEADKCILLCANCHREFHAGMLQLPQVTVVEKLGEFKETFARKRHGNLERNSLKGLKVGEDVQRLGVEET